MMLRVGRNEVGAIANNSVVRGQVKDVPRRKQKVDSYILRKPVTENQGSSRTSEDDEFVRRLFTQSVRRQNLASSLATTIKS